MEPWQQRVIDERNELHRKFTALEHFMWGEQFHALDRKQRSLLKKQLHYMFKYLYVLHSRIASW
jgi:hypothetical protein